MEPTLPKNAYGWWSVQVLGLAVDEGHMILGKEPMGSDFYPIFIYWTIVIVRSL